MFNYFMVINNFQNPYNNHGIYASQPLKGESINSSANNMPTMNRIVSEPSVIKKALNNAPPNFIRHVYVNNQSASNGSLTESFIRSRASLSPSYVHNEISTRYNMISVIPLKLTQIKKSIERLA